MENITISKICGLCAIDVTWARAINTNKLLIGYASHDYIIKLLTMEEKSIIIKLDFNDELKGFWRLMGVKG